MQEKITSGEVVFRWNDPARLGKFTGRRTRGANGEKLEVAFSDALEWVYEELLRPHKPFHNKSPTQQVLEGTFGQSKDIRRLMTFEKLKGTLSEIIYAMDSADIEFMPYQYKPVLKMIDSMNDRLLLADEVGLGKTIEAGLIWQELRVRKKGKRLLILCPKTLAGNWKSELLTKFSIRAEIVNAEGLLSWVNEVKANGDSTHFALIATYPGVRIGTQDLRRIEENEEPERDAGKCYKLLDSWSSSYPFADLAIFDEAHILRNRNSNFSKTASAFSRAVDGLVCVSATPVNNSSSDLYSLLQILDPELFENESVFKKLREDNEDSVRLANALSSLPPKWMKIKEAFLKLKSNELLRGAPLIGNLEEAIENAQKFHVTEDAAKYAEALVAAEKFADQLNLLSKIISRTRRRQIKEMPAVRDPVVLVVPMSVEERRFYDSVTSLIRKRLTGLSGTVKGGRFLAFGAISPQLRMASCMPMMVDSYRKSGRTLDFEEIKAALEVTEEDSDPSEEMACCAENLQSQIEKLIQDYRGHDFEANDTKFAELKKILSEEGLLKSERKLVVFSYFRGTLEYLERRLTALGLECIVLHGGITEIEERQKIIETFKSPDGPRILLSSEVGSEGINLQFCRCIINYDLPWNPMRVEQRIGRIDRVGQKAERLSIIHFKVPGTIDACVYEKLYAKIDEANLTIGEMECILGREIQTGSLFEVMFDDRYTDDERAARFEEKTKTQIRKAQDMLQLEAESGNFEGLSDYIKAQIDRGRKLCRFVTPDELRSYVKDYFDNEGAGSQFVPDHRRNGIFSLNLSESAWREFDAFSRAKAPESSPAQKEQRMLVTFDKENLRQGDILSGKKVILLTGLSPLIKWITSKLTGAPLHPTFKVRLKSMADFRGVYYCLASKWKFSGKRDKEVIRYFMVKSDRPEFVISGDSAENVFTKIVHEGESLLDSEIAPEAPDCIKALVTAAEDAFSLEEDSFVVEDQTLCHLQLIRLEEHLKHRMRGPELSLVNARKKLQALEADSAIESADRERAIKKVRSTISGLETRLENLSERYLPKIQEVRALASNSDRDASYSEAAAGIVLFD